VPRVKRLTRTIVDEAAPLASGSYYLMDESLPGFGVRVYPTRKVWVVRFRKQPHQLASVALLPLETARREARDLLLRLSRGELVRSASPVETVADLFALMDREHYSIRLSPGAARRARGQWRNNVIPRLGGLRVAEAKRDHIREFMLQLQGIPQSANACLALLNHAFRRAELADPPLRPLGSNPCQGVDRYPIFPRERVLSEEEFGRLGRALEQIRATGELRDQVLDLILFLSLTGCRPSEGRTLRWDQVEILERQLQDGSVRHVGRAVLPTAKSDRSGRAKGRIIWLSGEALAVLRRQEPVSGNPYVFTGIRPGAPISHLARPWRRVRTVAGLPPDVVPYSLRQSYVTEGDAADVDLGVMKDLAGHVRIATTDRVYRKGVTSAQVEAAERMGAHLQGLLDGKPEV